MIRVVVVDDEALVRSGFRLILGAAEDIEVVAATTGADAVQTVRRERPHVVLLDIRMPDVDGLTVLRELRELPDAPVVAMLTTFDTDEYVLAALNAGAGGFLLKDTEPEQLAPLVRTLAAGGVVLSPKVSRTLLRGHTGAEGAVDDQAARVQLLTGPGAGLPILELSRHLGHATTAETTDTYGHLLPDPADRTRRTLDHVWNRDDPRGDLATRGNPIRSESPAQTHGQAANRTEVPQQYDTRGDENTTYQTVRPGDTRTGTFRNITNKAIRVRTGSKGA